MKQSLYIFHVVVKEGLSRYFWLIYFGFRIRKFFRLLTRSTQRWWPGWLFLLEMSLFAAVLWRVVLARYPEALMIVIGCTLSIACFSSLLEHILKGLLFPQSQIGLHRPIHLFALFSRWLAMAFLIDLIEYPQLIHLPFGLLAFIIPGCLLLLAFAMIRHSNLHERDLKNLLLISSVCLLVVSMLGAVPASAGFMLSVIFVSGGLFLVFYTTCWLLYFILQLSQNLWPGDPAL